MFVRSGNKEKNELVYLTITLRIFHCLSVQYKIIIGDVLVIHSAFIRQCQSAGLVKDNSTSGFSKPT